MADGAAPLLGHLLEDSSVLVFLVLLVSLPVAMVPRHPWPYPDGSCPQTL